MDSGLYLKNLAEWKGNKQTYIYGKHSIKVYRATFGSNGLCWKCRDWRNCWNNPWVCKTWWRSDRQGESLVAKGSHEMVNNFLVFNF